MVPLLDHTNRLLEYKLTDPLIEKKEERRKEHSWSLSKVDNLWKIKGP